MFSWEEKPGGLWGLGRFQVWRSCSFLALKVGKMAESRNQKEEGWGFREWEKTERSVSNKMEEEQISLGEDTWECLRLKRSSGEWRWKMPLSRAIDRLLVTVGTTVSVGGSQLESDLRDEESLPDRRRSPGLMLVILKVPTVSPLLDSLLELVPSTQGSYHFFHLGSDSLVNSLIYKRPLLWKRWAPQ